MVLVKICGITTLKDGIEAANLGASALGFVFYKKSPRFIEAEKAAQIISKLPPFIKTVGLFVNPSAEEIQALLDICPIDILQLHGEESPAFCSKMPRKVIKAFRIKGSETFDEIKKYNVQGILLDAYQKGTHGGTGKTFNWDIIPKELSNVILAGGLSEENIRRAIKAVKPYAVDLSSGVETKPGIKSSTKLRSFFSELMQSKG